MTTFPEENIRQALLATFTSSNVELIQQAENYLKGLSSDLNFIIKAFKIIGKNGSTWSIVERQAFSVLIKNIITSWNDEMLINSFPTIQQHLIELLFDVTSEIGIRNITIAIIRHFFSNIEIAPLEKYIFGLFQNSGNDLWKMQATLLLMNEYTKQLNNRNASIHEFVNLFGQPLLQLYSYLTQETMKSDNFNVMINMRYNIVKSLWHCIRKEIPDSWKKNIDQFKQWNNILLLTYKTETPIMFQRRFPPSHFFFKEKRLAAHVIYSIYIRTVNIMDNKGKRGKKKSAPKIHDKKVAEIFLGEYSVKYMELFIDVLRSYINFEQTITDVSMNEIVSNRNISVLIVYLDSSVSNNNIFDHVWKPHLNDFFRFVLFPFIQFKKEDYRLMVESPNDFLFQNFEENDDIYSLRISASQVFYELLGYRNKIVINPFLKFVSDIVSDKSSSPQALDGILYLILHLKKVIDIEDSKVSSFLEKFAKEKVFQYSQSEYSYLVARSIAFLGEINFLFNIETLKQATQLIINALRHNDIVVRTQAAIAISKVIQTDDEICQNIKPLVPDILKTYIEIMGEIENSTLIASLSEFGNKFSDEMRPYALETCGSMIDMFLRLAQQEDEDEDGQIYDACTESLRTLYILLNAVLQSQENSSSVFVPLEEKIIPMLIYILNDDSLSFIDAGMEILTLYTYTSQYLSQNIWMLFPKIIEAYYSVPLYEYINHLLAPLDNFISYGKDYFLSQPQYVKAVFDIIANYLNDFDARESLCQAPTKLLSVLYQNCLGSLDHYFQNSMNMILQRLSKAKTPALKILLFDSLSDLIYYNPNAAFEFIENTRSVDQIFKLWFESIKKMTRVYDKKISSIGLSKLLEIGLLSGGSAISRSSVNICKNQLSLISNIQKQRREIEEKSKNQQQDILNGIQNMNNVDLSSLINGGDLDGIGDSAYIRDIMSQIKEINVEDEEPSDDQLEDETISTPLDNVDEVKLFASSLILVRNTNPQVFNQLIQQLDVQSRNQIQAILQS